MKLVLVSSQKKKGKKILVVTTMVLLSSMINQILYIINIVLSAMPLQNNWERKLYGFSPTGAC